MARRETTQETKSVPPAPGRAIKRGWDRALGILRGRAGRTRMEQALRRSEEELRIVTDQLTLAIAFVDSEQRYWFVNKAYEEWVQRSHHEIRGRHIGEILGEPVYERIRGHIEAALSGETVTFAATLPYREKGLRDVSATYSPYIGGTGGSRRICRLNRGRHGAQAGGGGAKRAATRFSNWHPICHHSRGVRDGKR